MSSSIQCSKATVTQPALGYSGHTLVLASGSFHPPSSCEGECPQTEPSHITSLHEPCQLFPRVIWVKFNLFVHLIKRARPHLISADPPSSHFPLHFLQSPSPHHSTPSTSCPPRCSDGKLCPLECARACYVTPLLLPRRTVPSFQLPSSPHRMRCLSQLCPIPSDLLAHRGWRRDGQRLAVAAPVPEEVGKGWVPPSKSNRAR